MSITFIIVAVLVLIAVFLLLQAFNVIEPYRTLILVLVILGIILWITGGGHIT